MATIDKPKQTDTESKHTVPVELRTENKSKQAKAEEQRANIYKLTEEQYIKAWKWIEEHYQNTVQIPTKQYNEVLKQDDEALKQAKNLIKLYNYYIDNTKKF